MSIGCTHTKRCFLLFKNSHFWLKKKSTWWLAFAIFLKLLLFLLVYVSLLFWFLFFFCYASSIRKLLYPCPSLSDIKETNMMAVNVRKILLPFSKGKEMVSFSQLDVRGMSFYHLYLSNENFWCLSWLLNGTECTLWHILSCFATSQSGTGHLGVEPCC